MRKGNTYLLLFILALFGFCMWAILPASEILGREEFKLGLDLRGGSHLVYKVDLTKKDPSQSDADVIQGVKQKIERRVNAYGVTEPIVQTIRSEQGAFILVQLPGVEDVDEAIELIGQTAELDFREMELDESGRLVFDEEGKPKWTAIATATGSDGKEKELTGKYLKPNAKVVLDPRTNEPQVAFEWNEEGAHLFEQITERNLNKPLGIYLDDEPISWPTVQAVIKKTGVITGLTLEEARTLAIQLNSGSLDVPLEIVERRDIGATLGEDSLRKSLIAGIIGTALVVAFMIGYYRFTGFVACMALAVFVALNLAVFKLIPVVLTLPGIAGFIVSVGMGVDGNVLVAERLKEELRRGRTLGAAVEEGFRQSWTAIFDANVTVFIACIVLYWLGNTFGNFLVMGFATTLFIGTALSMFTQVVVTRTFMRTAVGLRLATSPRAYGVLEQ
ncbi:MAG TPA: protein translocase subunit SecD [Dehalococcoidia bacterium]|nr:protein translocase subunit SecD [Dehalococcoidia bacterium]